MNETDKLIEEQFKTLPPSLQQAINAVPWKSSIKEIVMPNKLSQEQADAAERETMFILYGFENSDDYIANLMREMQISEEMAIAIAEAVNERIFKTITQKVEELEKQKSSVAVSSIPEVPPTNLPMVEKGEVAHDVKPQAAEVGSMKNGVRKDGEKPKIASTPDYRYGNGKDPYREPLV